MPWESLTFWGIVTILTLIYVAIRTNSGDKIAAVIAFILIAPVGATIAFFVAVCVAVYYGFVAIAPYAFAVVTTPFWGTWRLFRALQERNQQALRKQIDAYNRERDKFLADTEDRREEIRDRIKEVERIKWEKERLVPKHEPLRTRLLDLLRNGRDEEAGNLMVHILMRPDQSHAGDEDAHILDEMLPEIVRVWLGVNEEIPLPTSYRNNHILLTDHGSWGTDRFIHLMIYSYIIGASIKNLPQPYWVQRPLFQHYGIDLANHLFRVALPILKKEWDDLVKARNERRSARLERRRAAWGSPEAEAIVKEVDDYYNPLVEEAERRFRRLSDIQNRFRSTNRYMSEYQVMLKQQPPAPAPDPHAKIRQILEEGFPDPELKIMAIAGEIEKGKPRSKPPERILNPEDTT